MSCTNMVFLQDVADPLYAHCKLHLDKSIAKKKVDELLLLYTACSEYKNEFIYCGPLDVKIFRTIFEIFDN